MGDLMTKSSELIYNEIKRIESQYTGNIIETIDTYNVKSKRVSLYIQRNPNGSSRYRIGIFDFDEKRQSEIDVLFGCYPSKNIDHETVLGTPAESIVINNSGILKNIYNILKAIGKVYNLPVAKKHL